MQCRCPPSEILQELCESLAVPPGITTLRVNTQRSKVEDAVEAISKILTRVRNIGNHVASLFTIGYLQCKCLSHLIGHTSKFSGTHGGG